MPTALAMIAAKSCEVEGIFGGLFDGGIFLALLSEESAEGFSPWLLALTVIHPRPWAALNLEKSAKRSEKV